MSRKRMAPESHEGGPDSNYLDVSVLTYNLYAGDDFRHERIPFMVDEITRHSPDILLLQECTQKVADALMAADTRYAIAWTKTAAVVDSQRKTIHMEQNCNVQEQRVEAMLEEVAEKLGWEKPAVGLAALGSGQCLDMELSELFIIINTRKFEVTEREMVHIGNWFDDGTLRVRLKLVSSDVPSGHIDVFNVHFCGGSFGKPPEVITKKRKCREAEFAALNEAIAKSLSVERLGDNNAAVSDNVPNCILVGGDFNCDPGLPEMFPECALSPELLAERTAREQRSSHLWTDVGKDLGVTESSSRNLFRRWLKPGQDREARFDRILVQSVVGKNCPPAREKTAASISCGTGDNINTTVSGAANGVAKVSVVTSKLVGDRQVGEIVTEKADTVPLFLSDHFGVSAELRIGL